MLTEYLNILMIIYLQMKNSMNDILCLSVFTSKWGFP